METDYKHVTYILSLMLFHIATDVKYVILLNGLMVFHTENSNVWFL